MILIELLSASNCKNYEAAHSEVYMLSITLVCPGMNRKESRPIPVFSASADFCLAGLLLVGLKEGNLCC